MLLIKNAKVMTMAGRYLPQGDVLIEGTRIKAVDSDISCRTWASGVRWVASEAT